MKLQRTHKLFSALLLTAVLLCSYLSVIVPSPTAEVSSLQTSDSNFTVRFIDVGQADSALISCDGHHMLIDGGNRADSDLIYTVLKKEEVNHLDLIIGTHSDEDHIGGIAGALTIADADTILCSVTDYSSKAFENFKKYAEERGNGLQIPSVGDRYQLGTADVEILAVNSGSSTNDTSIVTKVTYGETAFLFTGDAENETENFLLNSGKNLHSAVLKVSHHGSNGGSSEEFLDAVMPEYSVISVGEGNSYGHPTDEVLARLSDIGTKILRTDFLGDIIFSSDGTSVSYSTAKRSASSIEKAEHSLLKEDFVLNVNSMTFHKPNCKSVGRIQEKNRKDFTGIRDDVIVMGYGACEICKP